MCGAWNRISLPPAHLCGDIIHRRCAECFPPTPRLSEVMMDEQSTLNTPREGAVKTVVQQYFITGRGHLVCYGKAKSQYLLACKASIYWLLALHSSVVPSKSETTHGTRNGVPRKNKYLPNVGLMFGQRRRRWANIKLVQCIVFLSRIVTASTYWNHHNIVVQCSIIRFNLDRLIQSTTNNKKSRSNMPISWLANTGQIVKEWSVHEVWVKYWRL